MLLRFRCLALRLPFKHEAGTAIIEFAITLVFLILLTVGVTEIGRAFWYYSAMQKSARDGARCLSNLEWNASGSSEVSDCLNMVADNANSAGLQPPLSAGSVTLACDGSSCNWGVPSYPPGPGESDTRPEYVTVTVASQMRWLWSMGDDLPAAGENSGLKVVATMPYMK